MRRDLLPPWLLARPDVDQLIEEHGCTFLACIGFKNEAHLEHYLTTGDIRQPASVRAAERFASNPIHRARKAIADRLYRARRRGDERAVTSHQLDLDTFDILHARE